MHKIFQVGEIFSNAADRRRGILDISQESLRLFPDATKQLHYYVNCFNLIWSWNQCGLISSQNVQRETVASARLCTFSQMLCMNCRLKTPQDSSTAADAWNDQAIACW